MLRKGFHTFVRNVSLHQTPGGLPTRMLATPHKCVETLPNRHVLKPLGEARKGKPKEDNIYLRWVLAVTKFVVAETQWIMEKMSGVSEILLSQIMYLL